MSVPMETLRPGFYSGWQSICEIQCVPYNQSWPILTLDGDWGAVGGRHDRRQVWQNLLDCGVSGYWLACLAAEAGPSFRVEDVRHSPLKHEGGYQLRYKTAVAEWFVDVTPACVIFTVDREDQGYTLERKYGPPVIKAVKPQGMSVEQSALAQCEATVVTSDVSWIAPGTRVYFPAKDPYVQHRAKLAAKGIEYSGTGSSLVDVPCKFANRPQLTIYAELQWED